MSTSTKDGTFKDRKELSELEETDSVPEKKKQNVCAQVLRFLVSTGGLFVLFVVYIIAGGFIFRHLEQFNELVECNAASADYNSAENATLVLLLNVAVQVAGGALQEVDSLGNSVGIDKIEDSYKSILQAFSLSVLDTSHNVSKDCSRLGEEGGPQFSWSLTGATVFCMTVITTIGYGNIAPLTIWGRLVCIAYATLGIPITFLCLANLGEVMADIFRYIYATVCCCGCCRSRNKNKAVVEPADPKTWRTDTSGKPVPPSKDDFDDEDDEDEDEEEIDEDITVPLTITVIVIAAFIVFGAVLFSVWEDWGFVDASYFCYVTFTTIGFGDMVPGTTNLDSADSQLQLIITGIYQVVGVAVVSMCFQLMQDEIVAKFKWIGQKLGIGVKKEDKKDEPTNTRKEAVVTPVNKFHKLSPSPPPSPYQSSQRSLKSNKTVMKTQKTPPI